MVPAVIARAARGIRIALGAPAGLAAAAALVIPAGLTAQQGTITYTYSGQYDFEVPEGWENRVQDGETGTMLLRFGPSGSLMTPMAGEEGRRGSTGNDRMAGRLLRVKMRSPSRRDQEVVRDTWVSYAEGRVVETREFMGRMFLISGAPRVYDWRLTGEQAEHLGHMVIKATAEQDGTSIEAWFAPGIPLPGGPASYGGLPGMILVLSLDGGRTQYFATEVALGEVDEGLIRAPEDGDEISREEYEAIVEEKLDELERLYGRRGGGRE